GVKFTVRRLNYISRCERDLGMLSNRSRLIGIMREMEALCDGGTLERGADGRVTNVAKGKESAFRQLDNEYAMIHQTAIVPAYIRAGLESVEGLDVDGKPADVESFLKAAPDALLDEVFAACHAASDLTDDQRKNLQSPGSSDAPEAGQPTPTTAVDADA
ncbi:MAG: hypothetical protein ABFD89_14945, partial [Bryobacteraceae bacterium]